MVTSKIENLNRPIYFGLAIWGEAFCEQFLKYTLPTLLAPGNIPNLDNQHNKNRFLICTTETDWIAMQTHPNFILLSRFINIERVPFTVISEEEYATKKLELAYKYYKVTYAHELLLKRMYEDRSIGSLLFPDTIFAENILASSIKHLQNKKAVLVHFPRFANDELIKYLDKEGLFQLGKSTSISARRLISTALSHMNVEVLGQRWDVPYAYDIATDIWLPLPQEGMVTHSVAWHPIFIDYNQLTTHHLECLENNTFDGAYLYCNFKIEELYLITDSDEFAMISYCPHNDLLRKKIDNEFLFKGYYKTNRWLMFIHSSWEKYIDPLKLELLKVPVFVHTKKLSWFDNISAKRSKNIIEVLLARLKKTNHVFCKPDKTYSYLHYQAYSVFKFMISLQSILSLCRSKLPSKKRQSREAILDTVVQHSQNHPHILLSFEKPPRIKKRTFTVKVRDRIRGRIKKFGRQTIDAAKYILGVVAISEIPQLAKEKNLTEANHHLLKKYRWLNPASIRFLKELYPYLLSLEEKLYLRPTSTDKKEKFLIHLCCWGESYCKKVIHFLFPSLLSADNIPFMAKRFAITIMIHCDEASQKIILQSTAYSKLAQYVNFEFVLMSKKLINAYQASVSYYNISFLKKLNFINSNLKYLLLGGLQTHAFSVAIKEQAIISLLMPDMVLSSSFFKDGMQHLAGKKALLATSFRTNFKTIESYLLTFYDEKSASLSISAEILTELQLQHIHHSAKRRVVSEKTNAFNPTAQLLFQEENGYVIRAYNYHPMLLDCKEINPNIKLDYFPIDNGLLEAAFTNEIPYEQQLKVSNDSSSMCFIELSDEDIENEPFLQNNQLNYSELVDKVKLMVHSNPSVFGSPYAQYLSSVRAMITSSAVKDVAPKELVNDQQFMHDVVS